MTTRKPAAASLHDGAKLPVTLDDVEAARARVSGAIVDTDCDWSRTLSEILGCKTWLKFENQQFTASFKERGAINRLSALTAEERKRGVIAMSAGNHAQGVAYHAHRLGIPTTIVMPVNTPTVKVMNTRRHGAEVILTGETVEEAAQFAHEHGRKHGLTFVHPYDDPAGDRRPGHAGAGDAGHGARDRHADRADRRRRTDLGHRRGGQGPQARHPPDRRAGRALSLHVQCHQGHQPADARRHAGRGHRREGARPHHAGDGARAGRRHRAGDRARDRARREPADQHREDGGGRRRRGRAGGRPQDARPARRPLRRPRAVRRQHRHAAAGQRADARAGPRGAADPAHHRSGGSAGHAGQGRQPAGRGRRQHRRGLPPAGVLRPAGQGRPARGGDRDARPRASGRDRRQAQGRRHGGRGQEQPRRNHPSE